MWLFLILPAVLILFYLLLLQCRRCCTGMKDLRGWNYAHRGLHGNGIPENSMAAFRLALEKGYGIEFDVHLLSDGGLAVIHDASLRRTAGVDIQIEDLTLAQLNSYYLEGSKETIPTFSQVLELYSGAAPLIIELKAERGNYAALCEAVCKALDDYQGAYCIESFDPRCIFWLRKHRKNVIRGILAMNYFRHNKSSLPFILKFVLTHNLLNFLIRPDFIAYRFEDRRLLGNFISRKLWGAQGVTWTIKTPEEHEAAVKDEWLSIFEGFCP